MGAALKRREATSPTPPLSPPLPPDSPSSSSSSSVRAGSVASRGAFAGGRMEEPDGGFAGGGGGGSGAVRELVLMQQERRRRREEEEEEVRRQMFGHTDRAAFQAAAAAAAAAALGQHQQHHHQQAVDYAELAGAGGFYESEPGGSSEPEAHGSSDRPRGVSGSKRTRAAEVHNLSEKRRRSKINEKMKALQSLIPNSNKTDKASMLDEAIEYLKQLQLQVQMLSMRNGVYLNPSYLSGALEPVQASQMFAALGVGGRNVAAPNSGALVPPANQSSGAHHSFDTSQQNQPQAVVLPSCPNVTIAEPSFHLQSSQSHLRSFQLPESSEMMFRGEIMPKHHLTSAQERANPPEKLFCKYSQNWTPRIPKFLFSPEASRKPKSRRRAPGGPHHSQAPPLAAPGGGEATLVAHRRRPFAYLFPSEGKP